MEEKMLKVLEEKGIKFDKQNLELIEGLDETGESVDNILIYQISENEEYQIYEKTGNILHLINYEVVEKF